MTYTVEFLPSGRSVTVNEGQNVLKAARHAGLHINASCGGTGVCGKCRIQIESGGLAGGISEKLSKKEIQEGIRQACTSTVTSDVTVRILDAATLQKGQLSTAVPQRNRAGKHLFNIDELRETGLFSPPVEKFFLELPRPSAGDHRSDATRLIHAMTQQYDERHMQIGLNVLRRLRQTLREDDFRVTATLARPVNQESRSRLLQVQSGNWSKRNFGLAVDVGTTTIYGQLIDKESGEILAEGGTYNKQISYGEDVISRMIYAEKGEGLSHMHQLVCQSINEVIARLLARHKVDREEISSVTLAGNTAMTHLLLELEPHNIRRAPYVPVSNFYPPIRATDIGLELGSHAIALMYPAVSSYVGGDIVAGVMGSGMYRTEETTLFIDIGTNAEIVIGNREWLASAACSAGPAFEGGGILHGMRAAAGAIEDFSLDPQSLEPMLLTIDAKPARGICGSGLLIMIAELFETGVLDQRGRFIRSLDNPRLRSGRSGYEYVVVWEQDAGIDQDIVLTEVDIDNFIRAKGAIHAGIQTLLTEVGLSVTDLDRVILAGGFGSYIDLDSAITVGLLPETDTGKILYVGNGSLMGCRMSELSNHIRKDVVSAMQRMTGFELSEVPAYREHYVASLFLPHTDSTLFPQTQARRLQRMARTES